MRKKHGMCKTRFYKIWCDMRNRCDNKNIKNYKWYGGRGIRVCQRWDNKENGFENFRDDMHQLYLEHCKEFGIKNTSIDRIDVNGNYKSSNVLFSTQKEQQNNRRNNHFISCNGMTKDIVQWSDYLGVSRSAIYVKIRKGFSEVDVILSYINRR